MTEIILDAEAAPDVRPAPLPWLTPGAAQPSSSSLEVHS